MINMCLGIVIGIAMTVFFPDMQNLFVDSGLRDFIVDGLNGV